MTFTDAERRAHVARIGRRGEEVLVEVGDLRARLAPGLAARGPPRGPGSAAEAAGGPFRAAGRFPTIPLTCRGRTNIQCPGAAGRVARAHGRARRSRSRLGPEGIAERLRSTQPWKGRVVHWRTAAARPGRNRSWPDGLDARLVDVMQRRGVAEPYAHQAEAIERALAGRTSLVATPDGEREDRVCYTAPVLQSLLESEGAARSLFLYPTKALSQDQTVGLTALVEELVEHHGDSTGARDWHAFTYDGDTPPSVRRTLRDRGHMVLTNPYMLHQGILPNHAKWAELFRELRYIVVDEVHTLSGVFGSSVANVLRRLVRIARHYGADPRFLASSATVADPAAHAARFFGRDVSVVDEDASPSGKRIFGVVEPPVVNPVAGLRANALELGARSRAGGRRARAPDHLLLRAADGGRGAHAVPEGVRIAAGAQAERDPRLPRRLPPRHAQGDRGGAQERRGQGGGVDQRARARRATSGPSTSPCWSATRGVRRASGSAQGESVAGDGRVSSSRSPGASRWTSSSFITRSTSSRPRGEARRGSRQPRPALRAREVRGLRAALPRRGDRRWRGLPARGIGVRSARRTFPRSSTTWRRSRASSTGATRPGTGWRTRIRRRTSRSPGATSTTC